MVGGKRNQLRPNDAPKRLNVDKAFTISSLSLKPKMALQLWETLKEAIVAYTGLSPATFFTLLALLVAAYHVLSGLFVPSGSHHQTPRNLEEMQPLQPPVQLGEVTSEELKQYDGSDPKKPLLMAIKAQIYDVSQSRYLTGFSLLFISGFLFFSF